MDRLIALGRRVSTLRIYRIVHRKYAADPYSGKGGLHAASRWASRGRRVSYASESLALAAVEKIAGAGHLNRLGEMVYVAADLDRQAVRTLSREERPAGWDEQPPSLASREVGDEWLSQRASVALRVPSVVLPEGWNYVLNPAHADFGTALSIHEPQQLRLDPRVLEQLRA
jgi:RES domain-containing protein